MPLRIILRHLSLRPMQQNSNLEERELAQRRQSSIVKYDGALALNPQYRDAMYRKGVSLMAVGNDSEAVYLLDQVVMQDPIFKNACNALGLALEADGRYQEGLEAYSRSLEIDPKWNQPLINKIHAFWALGKNDEAVKILVRV